MWTEEKIKAVAEEIADDAIESIGMVYGRESLKKILVAAFLAGANYIINNTQKQ